MIWTLPVRTTEHKKNLIIFVVVVDVPILLEKLKALLHKNFLKIEQKYDNKSNCELFV